MSEETAETNDGVDGQESDSPERKKTPLELVRERQAKMRGQQASSEKSQGGGGGRQQSNGGKRPLFQRKSG
ncbi:MAG TPA: hypothetical protein VF600_12425 [Abditibacteriaceae bacterium]